MGTYFSWIKRMEHFFFFFKAYYYSLKRMSVWYEWGYDNELVKVNGVSFLIFLTCRRGFQTPSPLLP
jgi:hypothetical protein